MALGKVPSTQSLIFLIPSMGLVLVAWRFPEVPKEMTRDKVSSRHSLAGACGSPGCHCPATSPVSCAMPFPGHHLQGAFLEKSPFCASA